MGEMNKKKISFSVTARLESCGEIEYCFSSKNANLIKPQL